MPALYLPYVKGREHAFAEHLRTFAEDDRKGSVLLLHAPTGAGKTRAVMELSRQHPTLLTLPTNALAAEVEATYRRDVSHRVARWNAEAFTTQREDRHQEMIQQTLFADLVVSNPDLLHLFTQHEYTPRWKVRLSNFGMKNLRLLVFDEYHAYDERVLAAILLYLLKSRGARDNQHRFVFMSATPEDGLGHALRALGIPFAEVPEQQTVLTPLSPDEGRMIKGELDVDVSSEPIASSLPTAPRHGRALFIFSTFAEQQRAVRTLVVRGFREEDDASGFVQITGRKTGSSLGQDTWDHAGVLLGTCKVEQGLNIQDLGEVVMEPGWSDQQFWQRFGRAGRGRSARIRLHFSGYPDSIMEGLRAACDYEGLAREVRALLRPTTRHTDTILRFVGAYAASYHENTPASSDADAVSRSAFPGPASSGYGLVQTMYRTWEDDPFVDDEGGSREWYTAVRRSLRGLRGRQLTVPAEYAWSPGEVVDEQVVYILCRTQYSKKENGRYWIDDFLDKPKDANLHYRILDGESVVVPVKGSLKTADFRRLSERMASAIRRNHGGLPPFWEALVAWLRIVPPDEIAPLEVTPDDTFI